jgi:hypothetical protein
MEVSKPAVEVNQQGALALALSKAQAAFQPLKRDGKAEIIMKSGGKYGYSYATLAACFETTRKALADNELAITQVLESRVEGLVLITRLIHSAGGEVASTMRIPIDEDAKNFIQGLGSSITYIRRYTYCALLGIVADEDDDGAVGGGQESKPKPVAKAINTPEQIKSYVATGVASPGAAAKPPVAQTTGWKPSEAQIRRFWALVKQSGYLEIDGRKIVWGICGSEHLNDLKTPQNYEKACSTFEDVINGATDGIDFPS